MSPVNQTDGPPPAAPPMGEAADQPVIVRDCADAQLLRGGKRSKVRSNVSQLSDNVYSKRKRDLYNTKMYKRAQKVLLFSNF